MKSASNNTKAKESAKGQIAPQEFESRLRRGGKRAAMQKHFGAMAGPSELSTNKANRSSWVQQ